MRPSTSTAAGRASPSATSTPIATCGQNALADLPAWTDAIGRLLLQQQPDLAFADELAARWLHG